MGLFDFMKDKSMENGVAEWKATEGAVLLDVRSESEYARGHVPGSVNIPVNAVARVLEEYPDKNTPLFVYCLSGSRSGRAVGFLERQGYTRVMNIGGISGYPGEVVR